MNQSKLMHFVLLASLLAASAISSAIAAELTQETLYGSKPVITTPGASPSAAGLFNRLMKAPQRRHLPPMEDGIHDPTNEGTRLLQTTQEGLAGLPKSASDHGNGVDWAAALNEGKIKPRWVYNDPAREPMVKNMALVRTHKGSLQDEIFRHKQHTELLYCSDCHPDIFVAQNGANIIPMSSIMLGQKCGVCHGKVAFPIADCNVCHSQPKVVAAKEGAAKEGAAKVGAKP